MSFLMLWPLLSERILEPPQALRQLYGANGETTLTIAILDADQKLLTDPEQMLALADMLLASQ